MAVLAAVAATLALAGQALGQTQKSAFHPTRTVTIIVPYSPGGGTDVVGRLMAKSLEEMWGQPVIIDNKTGGSGSVGAAIVARATPDGHTMVLAVSGIAINAHLLKLPYDTLTAFAPVTAVSYPVATLIASPTLPANDLKELAELVRKEGPDKRTFASPDPGSRLIAERIFEKADIKLMNIPYKGAASFVGDISAGRVDTGMIARKQDTLTDRPPPSPAALATAVLAAEGIGITVTEADPWSALSGYAHFNPRVREVLLQ